MILKSVAFAAFCNLFFFSTSTVSAAESEPSKPQSVICSSLSLSAKMPLEGMEIDEYERAAWVILVQELQKVFGWSKDEILTELEIRVAAYGALARVSTDWSQEQIATDAADTFDQLGSLVRAQIAEIAIRDYLNSEWTRCRDKELNDESWARAVQLARLSL